MKVFAMGHVIEPEILTTKEGKSYVSFGLLSGKQSVALSVWSGDKGGQANEM